MHVEGRGTGQSMMVTLQYINPQYGCGITVFQSRFLCGLHLPNLWLEIKGHCIRDHHVFFLLSFVHLPFHWRKHSVTGQEKPHMCIWPLNMNTEQNIWWKLIIISLKHVPWPKAHLGISVNEVGYLEHV